MQVPPNEAAKEMAAALALRLSRFVPQGNTFGIADEAD
jgi:hypothetical protein